MAETPTTTAHHAHAGHFARHFLEMMVPMFVGMFAGGAVFLTIAGGLTPEEGMRQYPVSFTLWMAFSMTAPMVAWMRFRGHSWPSCREMALVMVAPACPILCLYWLGIISAPLCGMYCFVSMVAMVALMVVRRREYAM
jgi:hypothetical protein